MSHNVYTDKLEEILTIGNRQNYINNKAILARKAMFDLAVSTWDMAITKEITYETFTKLFEHYKKIQKPLTKIEEITDYEKSVFEDFLNKAKKECNNG